jgi:hypothetical protein
MHYFTFSYLVVLSLLGEHLEELVLDSKLLLLDVT